MIFSRSIVGAKAATGFLFLFFLVIRSQIGGYPGPGTSLVSGLIQVLATHVKVFLVRGPEYNGCIPVPPQLFFAGSLLGLNADRFLGKQVNTVDLTPL